MSADRLSLRAIARRSGVPRATCQRYAADGELGRKDARGLFPHGAVQSALRLHKRSPNAGPLQPATELHAHAPHGACPTCDPDGTMARFDQGRAAAADAIARVLLAAIDGERISIIELAGILDGCIAGLNAIANLGIDHPIARRLSAAAGVAVDALLAAFTDKTTTNARPKRRAERNA